MPIPVVVLVFEVPDHHTGGGQVVTVQALTMGALSHESNRESREPVYEALEIQASQPPWLNPVTSIWRIYNPRPPRPDGLAWVNSLLKQAILAQSRYFHTARGHPCPCGGNRLT